MVGRVFGSTAPSAESVRALRGQLRIKVLVVQPGDPVWPGDAIAASGAYRLVETSEDAKIYLANE